MECMLNAFRCLRVLSYSPEMALRLEKMGWSKADHWLRLQMNYDLAQVRERSDEIQVRRPAA